MRVASFKSEHLRWLVERNLAGIRIDEEDIEKVGHYSRHKYTILDDQDQVLCCFGITEYWEGRGEVWAILNQKCKRDFLAIHNIGKRFFQWCPIRRIEAAVETDFEAGHRWMRAFGFIREAERLTAYFPDGKDATLYVRVK